MLAGYGRNWQFPLSNTVKSVATTDKSSAATDNPGTCHGRLARKHVCFSHPVSQACHGHVRVCRIHVRGRIVNGQGCRLVRKRYGGHSQAHSRKGIENDCLVVRSHRKLRSICGLGIGGYFMGVARCNHGIAGHGKAQPVCLLRVTHTGNDVTSGTHELRNLQHIQLCGCFALRGNSVGLIHIREVLRRLREVLRRR